MTAPKNPASRASGRYGVSRMMKRRAAGTVEAALAELTDAVGAGHAAALLNLQPSSLYRKADPDAGQQLTLAEAGALTAATKHPALARFLAVRGGFALIPITPIDDGRLAGDIATLGQTTAQAFGDYAQAIADGTIDDLERQGLIRDLEAVLDAAGQAIADLSPPGLEDLGDG